MSELGNNAASTLVDIDTLGLISEADNVVNNCTGSNCNISEATRTTITHRLSELAQTQANATLLIFFIPSSSTLGRQIYEAYLNLGAAVSSVYNFQCGNSTVNSISCVNNATSVQTAKKKLQSLLIRPADNEIRHIVITAILAIVGIVAFIMFFIFLIIGLFQKMLEAPEAGARYMQHIQNITNTPNIPNTPTADINTSNISVPASPFETIEPIYK